MKKIWISFLLVLFILPVKAGKKSLSLEDIFVNGIFSAKGVYGIRFMNNGQHYSTLEAGNILKYDLETGNLADTILNSKWLKLSDTTASSLIDNYQFSKDEKKILIASGQERIYRHSIKADYYVWDIETQSSKIITKDEKIYYTTFSPDASKLAFVKDNNLFYYDLAGDKEFQVTFDGKKNEIINGATDWVYEEELGFTKAFFWSPDSKKIAYYRFNETEVPMFTMLMYSGLYPEPYTFKYPKAGEKNAIVNILVYDLEKKKTVSMDIGQETDQYIPRIKWTQDPDVLCIQRMNRHQNRLELLLADVATGNSRIILTEKNDAYISVNDNLTFLKEGKHFILTSEQSGFNHLYLYTIEGELKNQITKGEWDVTRFYGIDEKTNTVYYQSAEISPLERHIYAIKLDGTGKTKLSKEKGDNRAKFNMRFTNYINYHSNASKPLNITLNNINGNTIRVLENNQDLIEKIKDYQLSPTEFFTFKTSEGVQLNGWMIKPQDFNPRKKYPVLMYVYGGPGAQTVQDNWKNTRDMWYQYLADKGYIIVSVDNRGTGARGEKFKKITYLQLGKYETIDQIEAAKYLAALKYVDPDRIGIWGWSYGGYMSSLCITKGADFFKLAIAVAPATNWRFYDTIYTERFMRTPQENPDGYDDNSPINFVDSLKGKYLLIHGTADDNVHFQNSVEMVKALIQANKHFEVYFYPDKNHSIYGGNTRLHLYTKMTAFISENL